MTDNFDYVVPTCRTQPRETDAQRAAMEAYCAELRTLIAAEGQRIRAELAANWPQKEQG